MIIHGFVSCDLCGTHMGKLWNEPAAAPDLLPAPDFRISEDCFSSLPTLNKSAGKQNDRVR
jgi:hypothetical protein